MYVGRIVAVGRTKDGRNAAGYRVSSRSFPNRTAVCAGDIASITPRDPEEVLRSPYIKYDCAIASPQWLVATNGTHTNPIAEKLAQGMAPKEALESTLAEMGYEKDDYSTPRIAAVVPREGETGWLGTVRADGVEVKEVPLQAGRMQYLATYEHATISDEQQLALAEQEPGALARALIESEEWSRFDNPVTAVAGVAAGSSFALGTFDAG